MNTVGSVLGAWRGAQPDESWIERRAQVADEHDRVLDALANGFQAYGFTTRLGHEDHLRAAVEEQHLLFAAHLVGPTTVRDESWRRLLSCVKLTQLSQGGSGISPAAYDLVLQGCARLNRSLTGNWQGSYSSGDVVPAAWWWADLCAPATGRVMDAPGVFIAAVNGHFVSTAEALAACGLLVRETALLLAVYRGQAHWPRPVEDALELWFAAGSSPQQGTVQAPVSLRDAAVVVRTGRGVISRLGEALEARLNTSSANPRFEVAPDGSLRAVSNGSFLDFDLPFALGSALSWTHLMGGLWQRLVSHRAHGSALQPAKVAQAYLERLETVSMPTRFVGADSNGIEDLRDQALPATQALVDALGIVSALRELAGEAGLHGGSDDVAGVGSLLWRDILRGGDLAWDELAALARTLSAVDRPGH